MIGEVAQRQLIRRTLPVPDDDLRIAARELAEQRELLFEIVFVVLCVVHHLTPEGGAGDGAIVAVVDGADRADCEIVAQWKAERFAKRPKPAKLASNAHGCVNMYRSVWRAKYMTLTAVRFLGLGKHRSRVEINHIAGTESGSTAGHLNKLLIGCR